MSEEELIQLIQDAIVANGNKEITADVLRPILIDMVQQLNANVGDLSQLNTIDQSSLVNALNEAIQGGLRIDFAETFEELEQTEGSESVLYVVASPPSLYLWNGTSNSYVAFPSGGGGGLDDRLTGLAGDLNDTEKETIRGKIEASKENTYNTLAEAQAAELNDGDYIYILGREEAGDGLIADKPFYFFADDITEENGGTVFSANGGKLKAYVYGAVNVKWFGAKENTECTGEINSALIFATENNTEIIIDDYFLVKGDEGNESTRGVIVPNGCKIVFTGKGKLQHIATTSDRYKVINIFNLTNAEIVNPHIVGDRDAHDPQLTGQWGHCIEITDSKNITIWNAKCEKAWGDGIYFGNVSENPEDFNDNIQLLGRTQISDCRRQGISVITGNNCYIELLEANDIKGHNPQAALDFEPNRADQTILNFVVGTVIATKCKHNVLFSSRGGKFGIQVKNIFTRDCEFQGLFFQTFDSDPNQDAGTIEVGNLNIDVLEDDSVFRMSNWYVGKNPKVNIKSVTVEKWLMPENANPARATILYGYFRDAKPENLLFGGFSINNVKIINADFTNNTFRPYYILAENLSDGTPYNPDTVLFDIYVQHEFLSLTKEDGNSALPTENVEVVEVINNLRNITIGSPTADATLTNNLEYSVEKVGVNLFIARRGFQRAILNCNVSGDITFIFGSSSGLTEIEAPDLELNELTITATKGDVLFVQRTEASKIKIVRKNKGTVIGDFDLSEFAKESDLNRYFAIEEIGLTKGNETVEDIYSELPFNSFLRYDLGIGTFADIYPSTRGSVEFHKNGSYMVAKFVDRSTGAVYNGYYSHLGWQGWITPTIVPTATEDTHAVNLEQVKSLAGKTEKEVPNTTQYTILATDVDKILKFTANAGEEIQLIYNENTLPDVNKSIVAMSTGDNYLIPTVGTEATAGTVNFGVPNGSLLRTTGENSLITLQPKSSVNDLAVWGSLEAEPVSGILMTDQGDGTTRQLSIVNGTINISEAL